MKKLIFAVFILINSLQAKENEINDLFEKGIKLYQEKSYEKAAAIFEKICLETSYPDACYNAGYIYDLHLKQKENAIKLYDKACKQNLYIGCYFEALTKEQTHSYKNRNELIELYNRACLNKIKDACSYRDFQIGVKYMDQENYKEALRIFNTLCKKKDNLACFNIGVFYKTGKGVFQDYTKAKAYFHKSCKLGYKNGCIAEKNVEDLTKEKNTLSTKKLAKLFINGKLHWDGGKYALCVDRTTEFKYIKINYNTIINSLKKIFNNKNISAETICNSSLNIQKIPTKQLQKLYIILGDIQFELIKDKYPTALWETVRITQILDTAQTSILEDNRFNIYRGHIVLTKLILENIFKESIQNKKNIPQKYKNLLQSFLTGDIKSTMIETSALISDKQLEDFIQKLKQD